ncbi:MAG TPA: hypothetical protein ENJ60_03185 [Aeromonadales bacterium]|nr:hypothetical protein [Aeromonadales bacterium]
MKRNILIKIVIFSILLAGSNQLHSKSKHKSRKQIAVYCKKAKAKIKKLEMQAKIKSTPQTQRCKRAYSQLRYQSCHMKKYKDKIYRAAIHCKRRH